MKIKIVNETGLAHETKVFDEKDGEDITKRIPIRCIQWSGEVGEVCKAVVELVAIPVQVRGEATFVIPHPRTGQVREVKSIEFRDGSIWRFDEE